MNSTAIDGRRMLFVCGVHRSGTTPFTRLLGTDERISVFSETGVIEDEGQFLQNVYAVDQEFGGVGIFALHPESHWTEETQFGQRERERILAGWTPHWDLKCEVLVEKTPANLVHMRYLQRIFPEAAFLVITRHPVAACMAVSKWTGAYMTTLMQNWITAHEIAAKDSERLARIEFIRYEDVSGNFDCVLKKIEKLVGFVPNVAASGWKPGLNDKYFARFLRGDYLLRGSRWKRSLKRAKHLFEVANIRRTYESKIRPFGYTYNLTGGGRGLLAMADGLGGSSFARACGGYVERT